MDNQEIQLEYLIQTIIFKDNGCAVHFEYINHINGSPHKYIVSLHTINSKTEEMFLLKTSNVQQTKEICLIELRDYLKSIKAMDSFTIIWAKKTESGIKQTSYFYCYDIMDALNKFFYNKNVSEYIIYEIKINSRA